MNETLSDVHGRLLAGMVAAVGPQGELTDALTGKPTPPDHYGHCSSALALALACPDNWPQAMQLVRAWAGLDAGHIGHLPFNRLMLITLADAARTRNASAADRALIDNALARCVLKPAYPSNNWGLLAHTCRVLQASPADGAHACAPLVALLQHWTTDAGAFIDFPADPVRNGRFSTPLAYHHKALFLAALAARHHPDPQLLAHVRRLLDWLVHCWDVAGYAGGFGRSNHALFGDACLLGALILLGYDNAGADTPVDALARRLAQQQRDDGWLWLDPAGPSAADAAWDSYMHLSVYNTWTAALVSLARHLGPIDAAIRAENGIEWRAARAGLFHDQQAGILCLRADNGASVMMSTRGQTPQAFSRDEVELRYAGGVIFHLNAGLSPAVTPDRIADHAPLLAPPVRIDKNLLQQTPALAGWVAVFERRGVLYGLTDFDVLDCVGDVGDSGADTPRATLSIRLSGQPMALTRATPSGAWQRLIAALDWRLFGGRFGRRTAHARAVLADVRAELAITVTLDDLHDLHDIHHTHAMAGAAGTPIRLVSALKIVVEKGDGVRYLNPAGYTLVGALPESCNKPCAAQHVHPPSSLPDAHAYAGAAIDLPVGTHTVRLGLHHDGAHWQVG